MQATNRRYLSDWFNEMHEESFAAGQARGERDALYAVLEARGLEVSATHRALIDACNDLATLRAWLVRASTASSTEDVVG